MGRESYGETIEYRATFEDDYICWLVWLGSGCKEREIIVVCFKSSVCISSGLFGSFGLAMDAKNEKLLLFAIKSLVCISSDSFGSAVDAMNKKLLLCALSLRSVYLVARVACLARLAWQWMTTEPNEPLKQQFLYLTTEPNEPPNITIFKSGPVFYSLANHTCILHAPAEYLTSSSAKLYRLHVAGWFNKLAVS